MFPNDCVDKQINYMRFVFSSKFSTIKLLTSRAHLAATVKILYWTYLVPRVELDVPLSVCQDVSVLSHSHKYGQYRHVILCAAWCPRAPRHSPAANFTKHNPSTRATARHCQTDERVRVRVRSRFGEGQCGAAPNCDGSELELLFTLLWNLKFLRQWQSVFWNVIR